MSTAWSRASFAMFLRSPYVTEVSSLCNWSIFSFRKNTVEIVWPVLLESLGRLESTMSAGVSVQLLFCCVSFALFETKTTCGKGLVKKYRGVGAFRNVVVRKHMTHPFQLEQNGMTHPQMKAENHITSPRPKRHGIFGSIIRKKNHILWMKLWCYLRFRFIF